MTARLKKLGVVARSDDDAAFRARLAPLAAEVLPPAPRPSGGRGWSARRVAIVVAAATAAAGVTGWFVAGRDREHAPIAGDMAPRAAGPSPEAAGLDRSTTVAAEPIPVGSALLMAGSAPSTAAARPEGSAPAVTAPILAGSTPDKTVPDAAARTESDAMIALLSRRGDAAMADGDIVGARLLFERAAALGSAKAATAAGKTYDAAFLSRAGARGIQPDQTEAAAWFRRAVVMGDPEASTLLARIEGKPGR